MVQMVLFANLYQYHFCVLPFNPFKPEVTWILIFNHFKPRIVVTTSSGWWWIEVDGKLNKLLCFFHEHF